ncbi:BglII/BstYI family type II restriction endonuclease [Nitrospirillum sp. BR 11163]|uniref:BglII/BstYI family type II restriction endonuclease n=1 Tax=Nitrospirillum sp. BR 11163 TaxID=3104323 RepID=UPI002AFE0F28|nr:BglII/BstYI family type II restriction endonuclease [Nitrospirillum sp. BR 11163]MEA1676637.1 BglII/BstYI family type II restriction endonuclease [Nitrospirillum sp. BR 11163]
MFPTLLQRGFQVEFHSHARAILGVDFPDAMAELDAVIGALSIPVTEIVGSGGGEAKITQRLRRSLAEHGWEKAHFTIEKRVNGKRRESISHEVDHVRDVPGVGVVALEIEWNNKDPFFDRDLENFKRLHAEGVISVGVIVTRGRSLQDEMVPVVRRFAQSRSLTCDADVLALGLRPTTRQQEDVARRMSGGAPSFAEAWAASFCQDKYGAATTHWRKLEDRVHRGVGNPCPLLLIGIPADVVTFDIPLSEMPKAPLQEPEEAELPFF